VCEGERERKRERERERERPMELESETMRGQHTICAIENADVANPTF
jgi:hypothetical protein